MDDLFAERAPVPLEELMPNTPTGPKVPERVARNEAAYISLMTSDPIQNYQTIMAENQQGSSETMDSLQAKVDNAAHDTHMKGTLELLGRKDVPLEMKKQLFEGMSNKRSVDPKKKFLEESFLAKSEGETPNEEEARLTTAQVMDKMYKGQIERQVLIDQFAASRRDDVLPEFAATGVIPFAQSKTIASASKPGFWNTVKGFLAPGSQVRKDQEYYNSLSTEGKAEFLKNDLLPRLEKMSLVGWGDAHLSQIDYLRAVTEGDDYFSTGGVFLLNAANVLDVVWLGSILRSGKRVAQGAKGAQATQVPFTPGTPAVGPSKALPEAAAKPVMVQPGDLAKTATPPKELKKTAVAQALEKQDEVDRIVLNSILKNEQPMSPLSAMMQSNPEKARATLSAIRNDTDGEFTKAMTGGNTPEQALIDALMPNVLTESGKVTAKAPGLIPPDSDLWVNYQNAGATALTEGEKGRINAQISEQWRNAEGLTIHDGMGGFKLSTDGNYAEISAVYGTPNGGFLTPEAAIQQATFALRNSGVTMEDVTLMMRDGLDYKPVKLEDVAGKEGNYLIRVTRRQQYTVNGENIPLDPFKIKYNWLDRSLYAAKADIVRNMLDPAAIMDPIIHGPVGAAQDKAIHMESGFFRLYNDFLKGYKEMKKPSQAKVMEYILEANEKQIKFDEQALRAASFTADEVDTIKRWKNFWDNQWYYENADAITGLNRDGYMKYVGPAGEDYIAKPISRLPKDYAIGLNQKAGTYLDPVTGKVDFITQAEISMYQAAGGEFAKLKVPANVNGTRVDHILVRNTPTEYLRTFKETDQVLNYRHGHFTRSYTKGAMFVDEVEYTTGANGVRKEVYRKAVAVGSDTPSAKAYTDNLNANNTNPKVVYEYRQDARGYVTGSDGWFDVESAKGRIAQRHRGQTLNSTGSFGNFGDGSHLVDPFSSAARAAQSMGARMGTRAAIDTMRVRIEKQFGHLFPNGQIPDDLGQIGSKGTYATKEVADARTSVAYYWHITNGYHNTLDDFAKSMFNTIGTFAGELGAATVEKGAKGLSAYNPSQAAKHTAFYSYIVLGNWMRQFFLQSSAGIGGALFNPKNTFSGQLFKDVGVYTKESTAQYLAEFGAKVFNGKVSDFTNFVDSVGIIESVHKNNLISGALSDVTHQRSQAFIAAHTAGYTLPMQSFLKGEQLNQLMWHSTVYRDMKAKGMDMTDPTVIEQASARIRALTNEMNSAGEFQYQQGSASTIMQFAAVPHKVFISMFNRKLSWQDKAKLAAVNLGLYGSVGTGVTAAVSAILGEDISPEDPDLQYALEEGMAPFVFNQILRYGTGDDKLDTDFASFNAMNTESLVKQIIALTSLDFGKVWSQTPVSGIIDPDKGRLPIAIRELARYAQFETMEGVENLPPATAASVLDKVLKISSGYSQYARGNAALKTGEWVDEKGNQMVGDPSEWEAKLMKYAGLAPRSHRQFIQDSMTVNEKQKEHLEQVKRDFDYTSRILKDHFGESKEELQSWIYATNFYMNKYRDDPVAMKYIEQLRTMEAKTPDSKLFQTYLKAAGIMNRYEYITFIKQSKLPQEKKEMLIRNFEQEFPNK